MGIIVNIVLLVSFLKVVVGQTEICQEHMVQECQNSLLSTYFNFSSLIIEKETIDNTCDRIDEAKKCIEDYVDNCNSKLTKEDYLGPAEPLFESCQLLRDEYLPKLDCFRQFEKRYDNCLKDIPQIVGSVVALSDNTTSEESAKTFCCSIERIIGCVVFPTSQKCGEDGAKAMQHLLKKQLPGMVNERCDVIICDDENSETPGNSIPKSNEKPKDNSGNSSPTLTATISVWSAIFSIFIIRNLA